MKQRDLARWLKAIALIDVIFCLGIMLAIVPQRGQALANLHPEMPWLTTASWMFLVLASIPIVAVGVVIWRIASEIASNNSFSEVNAARLVRMGVYALAESAFFGASIAIMALLGILSDGLLAVMLVVVVISGGLGVSAFMLSHLTLKAAAIKAENDLTV